MKTTLGKTNRIQTIKMEKEMWLRRRGHATQAKGKSAEQMRCCAIALRTVAQMMKWVNILGRMPRTGEFV
jgi:hypothetical protein